MRFMMPTLFLFLFCSSLFASYQAKVYVVYFGLHDGSKTTREVEDEHYLYLLRVKENREQARASLLYSYKHSINGFAAVLTLDETSIFRTLKEVIDVVESHPRQYSLQTTKSWDFLGLPELNTGEDYTGDQLSTGSGILPRARYGKDVDVAIFDTGIWPESQSFADDGMDPIPEAWTGKCKVDPKFDDYFRCNGKIIGAKIYSSAFEHEYGQLNLAYNRRSPRDMHGHGTHIASVVSGRKVNGVSSLGGFGFGNATGGAPLTRLAIYKVCWTTPSFEIDCNMADMLKAIDDAIEDGVDVMNLSIGTTGHNHMYEKDLISIALLHATKKNIIVVCGAGNNGPSLRTMSTLSEPPWVISVGSGSINRRFEAVLWLGKKSSIVGQTVAYYGSIKAPLVYAENVTNSDVLFNARGLCRGGSLDSKLVEEKIVLCYLRRPLLGDALSNNIETEEVKRAGGVGVIFPDSGNLAEDYALKPYTLPTLYITRTEYTKVRHYIRDHGDDAHASIRTPITTINNKPSPWVTGSSSRGPTRLHRDILKPDVIAPGVNILAAWSELASPVNLLHDRRTAKYNIASGTSIAAPHVAAVASLLRAIYPNWSHAAIRSAIVTTASPLNNYGTLIADHNNNDATPFSSGSGWLQPTKACDPGLVYDASLEDYLNYLCGVRGIDVAEIDSSFKCPIVPLTWYNLNHPSISLPFMSTTTVEVRRKVTNVGNPNSIYTFEAKSPSGFQVKSEPETLHFDHINEVQEFTIQITKTTTEEAVFIGDFGFGHYVWKDEFNHHVRSPIIIQQKE